MSTSRNPEDAVYSIASLLGKLTGAEFYVATSLTTVGGEFRNYRQGWAGNPTQVTRKYSPVTDQTIDTLLFADKQQGGKPFKPLVYPAINGLNPDIFRSSKLSVEPPAICLRMSDGYTDLSVSVGGFQPRKQNRLYAGIFLYNALVRQVVPHHIGTRFKTLEEYESAVNQLARPITCNALDHFRTYYLIRIFPMVFGEFQYFPGNPEMQTAAMHIDFKTRAPVNFLRFVSGLCGQKPIIWGRHPKDPTGAFWLKTPVQDFGIMARSNSWDPRDKR